jgi:hypothetical protein
MMKLRAKKIFAEQFSLALIMDEDVRERGRRVSDIRRLLELLQQQSDLSVDLCRVMILIKLAVLVDRLLLRIDRGMICFVIYEEQWILVSASEKCLRTSS